MLIRKKHNLIAYKIHKMLAMESIKKYFIYSNLFYAILLQNKMFKMLFWKQNAINLNQ